MIFTCERSAGSCTNCAWENNLAVKSLLVPKGKFSRVNMLNFQIDHIIKEQDGKLLLFWKQAPICRLQCHWSSCIIRELEKLPFLITQQSPSVRKVFSQRCQEEEGLFCADGRLTGFWVVSMRSSFQEVQQATGEPQATLSSAYGRLWNIRLNSHRDDICFGSGCGCYWHACFKWMASVAFFPKHCWKLRGEAQFSFLTSGFFASPGTAGRAFTPKPLGTSVFPLRKVELTCHLLTHTLWRAKLLALFTQCRRMLNLASTTMCISHIWREESVEGWVLGTTVGHISAAESPELHPFREGWQQGTHSIHPQDRNLGDLVKQLAKMIIKLHPSAPGTAIP